MKVPAALFRLIATGVLTVATAPAATITVTGTGDTIAVDGLVTLREAITSANNNASINSDVSAQSPGAYGSDTINFNIAGAGVKTINAPKRPCRQMDRPGDHQWLQPDGHEHEHSRPMPTMPSC